MKFIYTLFIILSLNPFIYSQVTLTSENNPVVGNVYRKVNCDTVGVNQGPSGANQTWNFTNLTRSDSFDVSFVAPGNTPFGSQFTNSNVASTSDNSNYTYYRANSSNLEMLGTAVTGLVIVLSNTQVLFQYPFTYNTTFTDQFSGTFTFGGFNVLRTGTITGTGDGWGTINLPFGSFANALRVRYDITIRDSVVVPPLVTRTTQTSYNWFVPGKRYAVLEIIYTTIVVTNFGTTNSKSVHYSPNSTAIGIISYNSNVPADYSLSQNYPNPFNPNTRFSFALPKLSSVSLKVFDVLGREVATLVNQDLKAGSYEVTWDGSNYTSGMYFYKISTGDYTETKKMMLLK